MKPLVKWVAVALVATSGVAGAATVPPDIPPGHWAYEAVEDLAEKGIVLGYPDGRFLGNRTLTRYEMAALLQRILRRLEQLIDERAAQVPAPTTPAPAPSPGVSPEDLAELRRLIDEFRVELTVIGTDLEEANADIAELQQLRGDVETLKTESAATQKTVEGLNRNVTALQRTKLSGYIQARYVSDGGIFNPNSPPNDRFFVRRGRLKVTHNAANSQYVLQIGAEGQGTTELRDAYVAINLGQKPVAGIQSAFWIGQFNVPFGHEIEYSSSAREFPERSFAENALFPGERDRGARLLFGLGSSAWFDVSALNGGGPSASVNNDDHIDYTARLKYQPSANLGLGVSGYWGKADVAGTSAAAGRLEYNRDTNGDGVIDQTDTPSFIAARPATPGFEADRNRWGVDAQLRLGPGKFRAEGYWGRQPNTLATPDVPVHGWYALYVHPLNTRNELGIRYDTYDSNRDTDGTTRSRWNAVWNHFLSSNLRLTTSYEWFPDVPTGSEDKGLFTFQAQHRF